MSARRIEMHRLQEMVRLHRMGTGCRKISRILRMSPNTEREYRLALEAAELLVGDAEDLPDLAILKKAVRVYRPARQPPQSISTVDEWADEVAQMFELGAGPKAIYDRLRLDKKDFKASLWAVRRMVRRLKRTRGIQPEDVVIAVETEPGEVAQVDFGYVGKLYDPERGAPRKAWIFVLVLGFSRHMVVRIVFDQRVETWLKLHVEALGELGGVPAVFVPDNLKPAVIRAAFGVNQPTALNRSYRELARHYGFKVDPTPPYQARKKGKVEAGVKYVKRSFFAPRGMMDVVEARIQLARWVREIAGQRIHGTTGQRPLEVFEGVEREALLPLPQTPFEMVIWKQAKVHRDSHIFFERRLYSVPWPHIGRHVWLRATPRTLAVYLDDERIATHRRRDNGYRTTLDEHLPPGRAAWRHRSRAFWEERADRLGPEVGIFVREVFDSDEAVSQLRGVQAIVTHLEKFPPHRARAACQRARHFGNYTYGGVKRILLKALDLEPLPGTDPTRQHGRLTQPRYARSPSHLLELPLEIHHAPN